MKTNSKKYRCIGPLEIISVEIRCLVGNNKNKKDRENNRKI
jgi:hypothetical protein